MTPHESLMVSRLVDRRVGQPDLLKNAEAEAEAEAADLGAGDAGWLQGDGDDRPSVQ